MCMACEEAEMYHRYLLLEQIAHGKMPEGWTAEELRAVGLPLPGEVTITKEADGTLAIRPAVPKSKPSAFACDSPDGE